MAGIALELVLDGLVDGVGIVRLGIGAGRIPESPLGGRVDVHLAGLIIRPEGDAPGDGIVLRRFHPRLGERHHSTDGVGIGHDDVAFLQDVEPLHGHGRDIGRSDIDRRVAVEPETVDGGKSVGPDRRKSIDGRSGRRRGKRGQGRGVGGEVIGRIPVQDRIKIRTVKADRLIEIHIDAFLVIPRCRPALAIRHQAGLRVVKCSGARHGVIGVKFVEAVGRSVVLVGADHPRLGGPTEAGIRRRRPDFTHGECDAGLREQLHRRAIRVHFRGLQFRADAGEKRQDQNGEQDQPREDEEKRHPALSVPEAMVIRG